MVHHVLAEVVVCAVGWDVTLPAMEMTAQATALLVLVDIDFGRRNDFIVQFFKSIRQLFRFPFDMCYWYSWSCSQLNGFGCTACALHERLIKEAVGVVWYPF